MEIINHLINRSKQSNDVGIMELLDFNDSGSIYDASSLKYEESSRRPSNPFEVKNKRRGRRTM